MRDGPRGFRQDSSCPALLRYSSRTSQVARTGMSPSASGLSRPFRFLGRYPMRSPTTPAAPQRRRFGLLPFRSPLLRESTFLSFPPGTEMFQFPGFAHLLGVTGLQPAGLPHSDTRGSSHACRSPRIFAACRVLHRFRKPRHPPSAISNFFCESNDFRLAFVKLYLKKRPISYASCFNLVRFSLIIVNELPPSRARAPYMSKTEETIYKYQIKSESGCRSAPKRRCSSHTFRYGYLVTT